MVLVAIDHNDWFRQLAPRVFNPLTFHVLGFFLLAFSFGEKPWSGRFIADRLVRYLVPFWWALAAASVAFGLFFRRDVNLVEGFIDFLLAALFGSADLVKASSGLLMLWFLPCLFGLICLMAFYDSLDNHRVRHVGFGFALAAHVLLPVLVQPWMQWFPFGLIVAVDVFVLGLIWRQLLQTRLPDYVGPMALILCIVCYGTLVFSRVHIEIGTLEIRALSNPWILLLHDLTVFSAMVSMIWVAENVTLTCWLAGVGKNSLLVYLLHPIFYVILSKIWVSPVQTALSSMMLGFHAFITTVIAVCLAYGVSRVVSGVPFLSAWITPKSWQHWPPLMPSHAHS